MGNVVNLFPPPTIRQAGTFIEVVSPAEHERRRAESEAMALAFAKSPRGHFETSINRLISSGHIDLGHAILMVYRDFRWDHTPPNPAQVGKVATLLARVPADDLHANMLARRAWIAVGAMRFDPQPPTDEVA